MRYIPFGKLAFAMGFLAIWQVACSLGWLSPFIVASPLHIVEVAVSDGATFLDAARVTCGSILLAVCGAWGAGIASGAVLGSTPIMARATAPILSSILAVPLVVWYPILMAWLGIGMESKIIYGILSGYFPIVLATLSAVQHIDQRYIALARSIGASSAHVFLRFVLPLSMPTIVGGVRIGTAFTVIGVLAAEMLASTSGIGFLISYYRTLFDTGHVYLGIIFALFITLAINACLTWLERRVGRWRYLEVWARSK